MPPLPRQETELHLCPNVSLESDSDNESSESTGRWEASSADCHFSANDKFRENPHGFIQYDVNVKSTNTTEKRTHLHPTISLPILVFIDMVAVSLVVPLLFQYYQQAGIASANQRELLASVFSAAQIVGGLGLGALIDARYLTQKNLLFMSFGGSALAYSMIVYGGFGWLIASRVLVGLVKQTMTVTTSILTKHTTEDNRTKHMGRLESSVTAAWVIGPSLGAIMFKHVHPKAPALLASGLFVVNIILAAIFLKDNDYTDTDSQTVSKQCANKTRIATSNASFWSNLKSCFRSKSLGSVIASLLVFCWITRATSYSGLGTYYEDMYQVEPHVKGYIQSYQRIVGFTVQSICVGPLLHYLGRGAKSPEARAISISALILGVATLAERQQSLPLFLMVLSPLISTSMTLMHLSLRSLLTREAPKDSLFSVFAALDVLQNVAAVTVPFYRTFLFRILNQVTSDDEIAEAATMEGDPNPLSWVISSSLHWLVAWGIMSYLLLVLPQQVERKTAKNTKLE
ncbi:unnamed protein product [Cylindrotheca closterium]|uniref:Major facilitator superfamily (MFS) profile domain-containing protein n=1 Tax=Cylindrotheca closterium TaxID=2856 RepID=A0AAD2FVN9_9STRA|nr:unnamed protein product [Cylindrotheca closterium]